MGSTPAKFHEYSIPIPSDEQSKTSTPVYRQKQCIPNLISNFQEPLYKVYTIFHRSYKKYPTRKCFGTPVPASQNSPAHYEWLTYTQVYEKVLKTAQLIQHYNLQSDENSFVGVMASNSNQWMFLDLAVNLLEYALVPFFQALNAEAVGHILQQTQMTSLFGSNKDLVHFLKQGHQSYVKNLITFDKQISQELKEAAGEEYQILVFYDQINKLPHIQSEAELAIPQRDNDQIINSIFTLSYTSGTTGTPKGAMISNKNMISCMVNCKHGVDVSQNDVGMSYLPLAHVFGRVIVFLLLQEGGAIGNFSGDVKLLINDTSVLKPTIFPAVPRVLNRFYDTVMATIGKTTGVKKFLFNQGMKSKLEDLRKQGKVTHKFYDKVVFKNLRAKLGGNVRIMITASAPISSEVMEFFRVGFSVNMLEAYGQTESSGASFLSHSYENNCGYVGGPSVGTEFKLQDAPDLQYLSSDKPYPRGEVCIRGPGVFMGYFKNAQKTNQAIDEEGWLHTGDVGMIVEGGALKIIDRVKNIFKLSQGQYIAPQKIERAYSQCEAIAQIFVYGDSLRSNIIAIIVPDEAVVMDLKKSKGWQIGEDYENDICTSEELRVEMKRQMQAAAKRANLNGLEQVKDKFMISPKLWTDGDLLTPTMKLKRHKARDHFKAEIEQIYEN